MKNRMTRMLLGLALVSLLSGCAVGQKVRYHDAELELDAAGNSPVAVASLDNRPYVKDGEKNKDYVGNLRGGFGNAFNLSTESGKPLADDMASVICASIRKKGYTCTPVSLEPKEQKAQIADKLKATKAKKLLLLTINEWLSSTYQNTGLSYDLDLTVMDDAGSSLAGKTVKGEDELGGSFWSPPAHAKEAVPVAYKKKLESMLNDPAIAKALK